MKCDDLIAAKQRDYWTRKQQQRRDSTQESADGNYRDPEKKTTKRKNPWKKKECWKQLLIQYFMGIVCFSPSYHLAISHGTVNRTSATSSNNKWQLTVIWKFTSHENVGKYITLCLRSRFGLYCNFEAIRMSFFFLLSFVGLHETKVLKTTKQIMLTVWALKKENR